MTYQKTKQCINIMHNSDHPSVTKVFFFFFFWVIPKILISFQIHIFGYITHNSVDKYPTKFNSKLELFFVVVVVFPLKTMFCWCFFFLNEPPWNASYVYKRNIALLNSALEHTSYNKHCKGRHGIPLMLLLSTSTTIHKERLICTDTF